MEVGVLYSGGKDSNLALLKALEHGHSVECLLHIKSANPDSYMFHTPLQSLVSLQAEAMEIPLVEAETAGAKEAELEDLEALLREGMERHGIEGVVTGAVRSVYQASRIQKTAKKLGLWVFNPLWLREELGLLKEATERMEVIIAGVAAYPLGKELLGKTIGKKESELLGEMMERHGISPAGEGGEIETFVIDSPAFKKRIDAEFVAEWDNYSGRVKAKHARLVEK